MTTKDAAKAATPDTYTLKFPIEGPDGKTLSELKLRRAKAKDIIAIEKEASKGTGNTAVTLSFLTSVNGLELGALDEIDADDLLDVSEMVVGFLPERLRKTLDG